MNIQGFGIPIDQDLPENAPQRQEYVPAPAQGKWSSNFELLMRSCYGLHRPQNTCWLLNLWCPLVIHIDQQLQLKKYPWILRLFTTLNLWVLTKTKVWTRFHNPHIAKAKGTKSRRLQNTPILWGPSNKLAMDPTFFGKIYGLFKAQGTSYLLVSNRLFGWTRSLSQKHAFLLQRRPLVWPASFGLSKKSFGTRENPKRSGRRKKLVLVVSEWFQNGCRVVADVVALEWFSFIRIICLYSGDCVMLISFWMFSLSLHFLFPLLS